MTLDQYKLWTAVVTPFKPNMQVDYASFESILKTQANCGNGLLVLGSTGEALNMTLQMKKEIVDFACSLNLKAPIMIGVSGHQLQETLEWLAWLETRNIQAYLMVTPLYAKPGDLGQYYWFNTLMDSVSRPVMLYNVPGRTGKELSLDAVKRLNKHKNFWAIKEASGSVEKFKQYLAVANGKAVYCGDDALMWDFAQNGAAGLVSVASNAWPAATNLYVQKCLNKTLDAPILWQEASNSLFVASNPIPVKVLMKEQGQITYEELLLPLHKDDLQDKSVLVQANQLVNEWYQNHNGSEHGLAYDA
jgi:4-hydroxy-tetrahydrodipicolinate synthase